MLIHADQQPATACMILVAAVYRTATGHTSTKFSRGTVYVYSACTVYLTSTELAPGARVGPTRGVS